MALFPSINKKTSFGSVISDCYTMSEVPSRTIEKSLGLVQYTEKGIRIDITDKIDNILQSLLQIAREKGANAVVNVRITTGTYSESEEWVATYIIAYGEAVILT